MDTPTPSAGTPTNEAGTPSLAARACVFCLLLCATLLVYRATPGKWGDAVIDYGREIYIAWQMSEGKTLYTDVTNYFGPASSLLNGVFASLGKNPMASVQAANVVLAAATAFLVFSLMLRFTGVWLSLACSLFFLMFTGLNLSEAPTTNYNFISPYSHELTHSITAAYLLFNIINARSRRPILNGALAGVILSAIIHMKSEVAIAAVGGTAAYLAWSALSGRVPARNVMIHALAGIAAFACCTAALFAYYGHKTSFPEALSNLSLMYRLPFDLPQPMKHFYASKIGLSNITQSVIVTFKAYVYFAALTLSLMLLSRSSTRIKASRPIIARHFNAISTVIVLAAFTLIYFMTSFSAAYMVPSFLCLMLATFLIVSKKARPFEDDRKASLFLLHLTFSILLLSKIFLRPSLSSYSTFLLFPALLSFFLAMAWFIPLLLARRGVKAAHLALVPLLLMGLAVYPKAVRSYSHLMSTASLPLDNGREVFLIDPERHLTLARISGYLSANASPRDSLAVVPEGAMLNYIMRMNNPTRYINLAPPEWFTFSGAAITREYASRPPTWIVLLTRDNSLYGYGPFCTYAREFCDFLDANYVRVFTAGDSPRSGGKSFGGEVYRLKRLTSAESRPPAPLSPSRH